MTTAPTEPKISFEEWCAKLDAYHEAQRQAGVFEGYGPGRVTEMTSPESWRDYYDDDWDPEDALDEDRGYWE